MFFLLFCTKQYDSKLFLPEVYLLGFFLSKVNHHFKYNLALKKKIRKLKKKFFYQKWRELWKIIVYINEILPFPSFSRSDRLGLIFNKWLSKSSICSVDPLGLCISLLEIKSGSFTMIINTLTFLHKMTDFFIFGPQYGLTAYIEPKLSIFRGVTVWA